MGKWIDIFKTGLHTDMSGRVHKITPEIIKTIERVNNDSKDDAAMTIGHPKDSSPAWGWFKRYRVLGDKLQGLSGQVVNEFAEAVGKGMFKKISVSLRPNWTIRHVAFLGGMPPAVKGLDPVLSFTEDPEAIDFEFAEGELNFSDSFTLGKVRTVGYIMQKLRDLIIEKFGAETADKVIQQYDLDYLKEDPPAEAMPAEVKSFTEPLTAESGKEEIKMEIKKTETLVAAAPADFSEKVTALESENAVLKKKNETLEQEKIAGEIRNFIEKLAPGKLLPKYKQGLTEILVDLKKAGQEINFSETEKKPAVTLLMEFIESVPVQVPTKEQAGNAAEANAAAADFADVETDPDRLELRNKALALSEKEKIPYATAVVRVMKGGN